MSQTLQPDVLPALANRTRHRGIRAWLRRYPVASFLAALVLAIVTAPFGEAVRDGDLLEAVRLTLVLSSAMLAVGLSRRELICGVLLVMPALLAKWGNHWRPDLVPAWSFLIPALLFLALVIFQLLRFILCARRIDSEVLCAGVAAYLLLGLLWAMAYMLAFNLEPDAFAFSTGPDSGHVMKGFTALYYSFITLATVGYGDIAPLSRVARMLAMMESMTGTLYVAILISRLVALYPSSYAKSAEPPMGNDSV